MQREQNNQVDGYIIKLYKKIVNVPQHTFTDDASFITWMNFDSMDIISVSDYHEFDKSLNASDLKDRERYQSRQKIYLYPLNEDQGLVLSDSALEKFPLIAMTFLDFSRQCGKQPLLNEKFLYEILDKCIDNNTNVKGQLYGSLSVYDYVLVLRGKTYAELDQVLNNFRRIIIESDISYNKTYTIEGVDLKYQALWEEEPDSNVSIRISCASCVTAENLRGNQELQDALQDGYQIFSLMGKYDYDITGKIKNTQKFLALFAHGNLFSSENENIYKTNTRFMSVETDECDLAEVNTTQSTDIQSVQDDTNQYIDQYLELEGLCPSIKESLLRLILRITQSCSSVGRNEIKKDLKNILQDFLKFLNIHQYEAERQDEFGRIINCINLLLDNRITAGMSDFETPHNVLRYSGANLKVLLAYSKFADKLFKILQLYKERNEQVLKYVHLVTTDTGAKITATVYLSYCERYRFININIPVDLLFDVQYVLPWITHEVGHFIRVGWQRAERNAAYFWSVSRVIMEMLKEYAGSDKVIGEGSLLLGKAANKEEGEKFDEYREDVCQYYQSIINRGVYGYNIKLYIPYNCSEELLSKTRDITSILQKVYEESIADIFMAQVLEIDSLTEYLQIQSAYYRHINVNESELPLINISRIMAVSVVLVKLDVKDYDKIKQYFRSFYDQCQNETIKSIAKQLKEYKHYFMIEPLVSFLGKQVETELRELLHQEGVSDICGKLRRIYKNIKSGDFRAFRDFVEGLC
ncbi:MAG: hypothetical protein K2K21_12940 [Lachnospiraceae bacterium]|nr:hypothetical protein [Lachnospiraceae bacterium]